MVEEKIRPSSSTSVMPGDRAKSRERKLKQLTKQWSGEQQWIYRRCELCGQRFVVNDYEDKRPRTPRIHNRICCPWCASRRGKLRMAEHILVERLADLRCINNWDGDPHDDDPDCKCPRCVANRLIIAQRKKELREDRSAG